MPYADPFRRAAILALLWCLVGLSIDTGADRRARWVSANTNGQFASTRTSDTDQERSNTASRPIAPR
jgi:hypothetical protein